MYRYFFMISFIVFSACNSKDKISSDNVNEKIALMKTDKAFSEMSVEKGMKTAFIEYLDSNGVLLRPYQLPLVGASAIDYLISQNDTSYTLKWQPQNAFVSQSADLGYTYGVYALQPKNADTTFYGTYVSIWKKQGDGTWKFVLDSGNDGIETGITEF